jgi:hypothetical protein
MTPSDPAAKATGAARPSLLWGALTGLGLAVALATAVIDQASSAAGAPSV